MRPLLRRAVLAGIVAVALGGVFEAGRLTAGHSRPPAGHAAAGGSKKSSDELTLGADAQRDIGLKLASVQRGRLRTHLAVTAFVAADLQRSATLRPFGQGRILTVAVRPGDPVHRGEVVVTYDDVTLSDLRMRMSSARASLADAQTAATTAREAYARGRALEGTVLAVAEVERRRATLAQASAVVATQRATLLDLQRRIALVSPAARTDNSGTSAIVSPIDGYVLTVDVSPGDMVDPGRVMVTLADLSDVWVLSSVFQNDVQRIDLGGQAIISVPGLAGRVFQATVAEIGHALNPSTGAVQVRCVLANPDRSLRIGMLANVQLPTRAATDALTIPASAVQRIDGNPVVFVSIGTDKFRRQRIETGLQTPDRIVVRRGLAEGEQVVAQGSFALKSQALQSEISGD